MMNDQIYARALLMAGELDARQQELLRVQCEASAAILEARLRDGMTPEDCREVFVTAAALQAVAAMEEVDAVSEFKAGNLTVKSGIRTTERKYQAEALMGPYLKDRFLFVGV